MANASLQFFLSANSERLTADLLKAKNAISKFSKESSEAFNVITKGADYLKTAIAGISIAALIKSTSESARELKTFSTQLNVSTQELQKWGYAAESVGFNTEKMSDVFKDVSEKIGDAFLNNAGEAKEALDKLGIKLSDIVDLSPDKQLLMISDALGQIATQSGKIQIMEALANDASRLIPLLDNNGEELRKLTSDFENMGGVLSDLQVNKLSGVDKALREIKTSFEITGNALVLEFADELIAVTTFIKDIMVPVLSGLSTSFKWLGIQIGGNAAAIGLAVTGNIEAARQVIKFMNEDLAKLGENAANVLTVKMPAITASANKNKYIYEQKIMDENVKEFERHELQKVALKEKASRDLASIGTNLSSIFKDQSEKAFRVHQHFAAIESTINSYQAFTKALAQGGIYGYVAAGAVLAAGIAKVHAIYSMSPSGGGASGGAGFGGAPAINDQQRQSQPIQQTQQPLGEQRIVIQLGNRTLAEVVTEGLIIGQDNDTINLRTENGLERVIVA